MATKKQRNVIVTGLIFITLFTFVGVVYAQEGELTLTRVFDTLVSDIGAFWALVTIVVGYAIYSWSQSRTHETKALLSKTEGEAFASQQALEILKNSIEAQTATTNRQITSLETTNGMLESRIKELETEVKDLKELATKEREAFEKAINAKDEEIQRLIAQIDKRDADIKDLNTQLKQVDVLRKERHDLREDITNLRLELATVKAERDVYKRVAKIAPTLPLPQLDEDGEVVTDNIATAGSEPDNSNDNDNDDSETKDKAA